MAEIPATPPADAPPVTVQAASQGLAELARDADAGAPLLRNVLPPAERERLPVCAFGSSI